MKRKVCRKCKVFVDTVEGPVDGCTHKDTTTTYLGRIIITNAAKSEIAEKVGISQDGEYAIKTR